MTWNYAYTPYIWPSILTAVLLIALSVYSGRRLSVPGARPFMIACLFAALWAAGSGMEIAAVDLATKIFWIKFQASLQLPTATAVTCFLLEYAWPGRWLTRRNLVLLSIPSLLTLGSILTNDLNHLTWRSFEFHGSVEPVWGPVAVFFAAYGYGLAIVNTIVFAWLFLRSPQHRWPVAVMFTGLVIGRVIYLLDKTFIHYDVLPLDMLSMAFEFLMYTIALFGFHIFDPNPLARQAVITQMREGMLVLDQYERVTSLNPAMQTILGLPDRRLHGLQVQELFPSYSRPDLDEEGESEISLARGTETRFYLMETSVLKDWRGLKIGRLVLLHDITEQKRAQAQLLEQQRALAMLSERERLARELHDGIGQVLGFVKLQAQAARDRLALNQTAAADHDLARLIAVAQDAHADVREYILGAKIAASSQPGFRPPLQDYLQRFSQHYELGTELIVPPDWDDDLLEATVEVQLLRVIQEALTNVRKHARAKCVQVILQLEGERAQVSIQDDGIGFDLERLKDGDGQQYGLGFLAERAEEVGGSVAIYSAPGHGTRVVVEVPVKERHGVSAIGGA